MGARVVTAGLLTATEVAECFGGALLDKAASYLRRCDGSLFPVVAKSGGLTRLWLRRDIEALPWRRDEGR